MYVNALYSGSAQQCLTARPLAAMLEVSGSQQQL